MRRAVRLSRRGFPAPNPHVGCVIVRDGEIVGEGFHRYAGGDHAEVVALRAAGSAASGATAYVTLEPCDHHGRTPPCSEALIAARVARVVVACLDPNPKACGGLKRLSEAGAAVENGLMENEARQANVRFLRAMELGRPYVVAKAAVSLDGRIALPGGESKWITGESARRAAHRLRAEMGAVLVGRRTAELDDPRLTARVPGVVNQPVPIVLDPQGRLAATTRFLRDDSRSLRVSAPGVPNALNVPLTDAGLDLRALLGELWRRGHTGLLVEGGARTIAGFFDAGLVDSVELFVAPQLLGRGPTWFEGLRLESISAAPSLNLRRVVRLGEDVRLSCEVVREPEAER